MPTEWPLHQGEFFIDNLLVRIHFIIVMIRWTGLVPWEFAFPFPGSLTSTYPIKICWFRAPGEEMVRWAQFEAISFHATPCWCVCIPFETHLNLSQGAGGW